MSKLRSCSQKNLSTSFNNVNYKKSNQEKKRGNWKITQVDPHIFNSIWMNGTFHKSYDVLPSVNASFAQNLEEKTRARVIREKIEANNLAGNIMQPSFSEISLQGTGIEKMKIRRMNTKTVLKPIVKNVQKLNRLNTVTNFLDISKPTQESANSSLLYPIFQYKTPETSCRSSNFHSKKAKLFSSLQRNHLLSSKEIFSQLGYLHRILFKPRKITENNAILIISIEGVLTSSYQNENTMNLKVRSDFANSLRELQTNYQIVLVSKLKLNEIVNILTIMCTKAVYITAAYKLVETGKDIKQNFVNKNNDWYIDYGQVFNDFGISGDKAKKVIVICPLLLSPCEMPFPYNILEYSGCINPSIYITHAPIPTKEHPFTPLTICLPHIDLQPLIGLYSVIDIIKQVLETPYTLADLSTIKNISCVHTNCLNQELIFKYYPPTAEEIRKITQSRPHYKAGHNEDLLKTYFLIVTGGMLCGTKVISEVKTKQIAGYSNLLEVSLLSA
ncbi:unnamed protein product [Blepharisma stoltei]|uniref:Uncharacterized protein n=1 Tax=Blepharisma stoltei TaxID=1481888 RepID=A0AAU9I8K7_9CILI|nr:unnamed protein product [Blepharisma stoltei]